MSQFSRSEECEKFHYVTVDMERVGIGDGNSFTTKVTLTADHQLFQINGKEFKTIEFNVVGTAEIEDLVHDMQQAYGEMRQA
jgi:hypothetical protein